MWPRLLSIGIGLWLISSPAVLDLPTNAADNEYIVGPLIISMGIISVSDVMRPLRYVILVAGAWLLLAPWVLGTHDPQLIGSELICGVLLIGCSLLRGPIKDRFGGGWRSLVSHRLRHAS